MHSTMTNEQLENYVYEPPRRKCRCPTCDCRACLLPCMLCCPNMCCSVM